jgi:hypothetical protein
MHVWVVRVALSFVVLLAGAGSAFAQLIPGWETKQFTLERIDADNVRLQREVEVTGVGPNAGQAIFADDLTWNMRTGEFIASGNVLLVSPTARLSAERVTFNTKTSTGTFETAFGMASLGARGVQDKSMFGTLEPEVYFYGDTIEKIGPDKYRITRGGFTTCVQPTPRWDVVSGTATINLGDYAILRNAVIRVKDVPVFYLPVLYYPIQNDDRATGFLLPTYGRSTYLGQSISNAFFWAINRSQDLTAFHDWYTKTGQGVGTEYRYMASGTSEGFFRAHWLNGKEATYEYLGETVTTPARRSYELRGALSHTFPGNVRARGGIDYFSDITTQQLYNNNIYEATRRQRSFGGSASGVWGGLMLTGNYQRTELFYSQTDSVESGYAPSVSANFSSRRLGTAPIYVSAQSEAGKNVYIVRQSENEFDRSLGRIDVQPQIRATLSTLPYLNVNASLGYRYTYFSQSLDERGVQIAVPLQRSFANMRVDLLGPVFSRVFSPDNAVADRLKHLIEPNFTIERTTAVENQDRVVLNGSSYDFVVGNVTRMNYGLTNRILVRKTPTDPTVAPARAAAARELLAVTVTQSYYTDERAGNFDQNFSSSYGFRGFSKFSPVALIVRTSPSLYTNGTLRLEYDAELGFLQGIISQFGVTHPNSQVSVTWSTRRQTATFKDNALSAASTIKFNEGRSGGTYYLSWDIGRGAILQQRWVGFYNAQCCGLTFEYQEYNFPALDPRFPIPKDRRFNMGFTLAGIGTFSNFFGTFGGGGMR